MGERGGATGLVLNIQRLSTEDGPGLRSTVFLKQCPLSCRWCHNPESISARPELQWFSTRCIGCRSCVPACRQGCITSGPSGVTIDRVRCDGCGTCAEECPSNALELLGRTMEADDLVAALCRDRAYYDSSGGGVTLSGGEPLAQPLFASAALRGLKARGVATAVDTCGFASSEGLEQVLPHADLVLYDVKMIDDDAHRALTGQGNEIILRNLRGIAAGRSRGGPRIWIRTPLIPGATATAENLRGIGSWIAEHLGGTVERWELCAFNNLCRDQYSRLGIAWDYAGTALLDRQALEALGAQARSSGVDPCIVAVTGAARADNDDREGSLRE
jgi:pyruvate formate lyase activating enzyme